MIDFTFLELLLTIFIIALPSSCMTFLGPHDTACLNEIWIEAGCEKDGHDFPEKREDAGEYDHMNVV